jgi:hypothetical protein
VQMGWYDRKLRHVRDLSWGDTRIFFGIGGVVDCRHCGKVKREPRLSGGQSALHRALCLLCWRRCRSATIKAVAAELKLDWHTVKTLEQHYMEAQLKRVGMPSPQVIGIDEIAIRGFGSGRIWEACGARSALHQRPERKENLTLDGKKALKTLLSANKRVNTAYVLKESFGQLWSCEREGWARRFFEYWRASLKWQRLKP